MNRCGIGFSNVIDTLIEHIRIQQIAFQLFSYESIRYSYELVYVFAVRMLWIVMYIHIPKLKIQFPHRIIQNAESTNKCSFFCVCLLQSTVLHYVYGVHCTVYTQIQHEVQFKRHLRHRCRSLEMHELCIKWNLKIGSKCTVNIHDTQLRTRVSKAKHSHIAFTFLFVLVRMWSGQCTLTALKIVATMHKKYTYNIVSCQRTNTTPHIFKINIRCRYFSSHTKAIYTERQIIISQPTLRDRWMALCTLIAHSTNRISIENNQKNKIKCLLLQWQ